MRTLKIIVIGLLVMLLLAGGGMLYFGLHEHYALKWVVRGAKKAFEQEDVEKLMGYVSSNYSDDYGFDFPMVRRFMSSLFGDFDEFNVIMENPDLRIEGDKATVQTSLWITVNWNGNISYIVGTNKSGAAVRIHLSKAAWTWKVARIEGVR